MFYDVTRIRLAWQNITGLIERLARGFACVSGLVLLALVVLTVISVIGRQVSTFGLGPIPGDFELVEHGGAFIVFWGLPWCQLRYGHVVVDIVARQLPYLLNWIVAIVCHLAMFMMAILAARQLGLGLLDKMNWGETSFILQLPIWWGYAAALPGAWLWVVTTATTGCDIAARIKHRTPLP